MCHMKGWYQEAILKCPSAIPTIHYFPHQPGSSEFLDNFTGESSLVWVQPELQIHQPSLKGHMSRRASSPSWRALSTTLWIFLNGTQWSSVGVGRHFIHPPTQAASSQLCPCATHQWTAHRDSLANAATPVQTANYRQDTVISQGSLYLITTKNV